MKRGLTIGLAVAALGVTAPLVTADSWRDHVTAADAVPAYTVMTTLREMGFEPNREPVRRGSYYVLHATDVRGVEMRIVADAHFGDVISITRARPEVVVNYVRGPRIIHVPENDDTGDAGIDDVRAVPGDDDETAPPPRARPAPQRRVEPKPRWPREKQTRAVSSPPRTVSAPPVERRTVLSAPPPPPRALSPIYPTPRFEAPEEKFAGPPPAAEAPPPPPGYAPPTAPAKD